MTEDTKLIALHCKACNMPLSEWVVPVRTVAGMTSIFDAGPYSEDGLTPVPKGMALFLEGDVLAAYQQQNPGWNPKDQPKIWMNLADILHDKIWSEHPNLLAGCCGPDGMHGPNRLCRCNAEIGTESSDCWTLHMFVPVPENTEWKTR